MVLNIFYRPFAEKVGNSEVHAHEIVYQAKKFWAVLFFV